MSYPYRREMSYSFGGPLTPGVKAIILANAVAFLLQVLFGRFLGWDFTGWFALSPPLVLPLHFEVWRVGTYMFLHGDTLHLVFNMLALFMFGCALERTWGTRGFYRYYFLCGLGGALFAFIPYGPFYETPIAGASGAIYGILLAYGMLFPNNRIWILMTFPVEARYLVMVWGFIAFVGSVMGSGGVAHIVHLGGFLTGYLLLRRSARAWKAAPRPELMGSLRNAYRRWRMKRLRKKFEEYYEKRTGGGNDPNIVH